MGRAARNVSEADALSYVFGYCIGQDFSARDQQARQTMLGKAGDGGNDRLAGEPTCWMHRA